MTWQEIVNMRVAASPFADRLERAVERFVDEPGR